MNMHVAPPTSSDPAHRKALSVALLFGIAMGASLGIVAAHADVSASQANGNTNAATTDADTLCDQGFTVWRDHGRVHVCGDGGSGSLNPSEASIPGYLFDELAAPALDIRGRG